MLTTFYDDAQIPLTFGCNTAKSQVQQEVLLDLAHAIVGGKSPNHACIY